MYPRAKIINGIDTLLDSIQETDEVIFDSILELDDNDKKNIKKIQDTYQKLLDKGATLIFDRSSNCDSDILTNFCDEMINNGFKHKSKKETFNYLLEKQIRTYIEFKDSAANIKKYSQMSASRTKGKSYGRPKGTKRATEKSLKAKEFIYNNSKDFKGKLDNEECIKKSGISRNMFYIYKKELKKEANKC